MYNVIVNEVKNENRIDVEVFRGYYIDEESYQQIKKNMCKTNDYFSEKELSSYTSRNIL